MRAAIPIGGEIPRTDRQNKNTTLFGGIRYGNLPRFTRSPQETARQCFEPIARYTQCVFVLCSMTDGHKKEKQDQGPAVREFAPPGEASDTEATEQCFEPIG